VSAILPASKTTKKTGQEPFVFEGKELPLSVLDFWQWSSSDLLGNAFRGILAEFIVASAFDHLDDLRIEWDEYDLCSKKGLKIEIKSSAYLQSWEQDKLSRISFNIAPTGKSQSRSPKRTRKSDVYIFCVLAHKDMATVNPLDLSQWDFYILKTKTLNKKVGEQKTITLSSLKHLKPIQVNYDDIAKEIKKLENKKQKKYKKNKK